MTRVLVLDGNQRSALAVTRSLGRRGVTVIVGEAADRSLAGTSRFCRAHVRYPSPYEDDEGFLTTVDEVTRRHGIDVVLPMTDVTTLLLSAHRDQFCGVLPLPDPESVEQVSDKAALVDLALRLGVGAPRTLVVASPADLDTVLPGVTFPAVIKPSRSVVRLRGRWVRTSVHYATSPDALRDTVRNVTYLAEKPFLIQEYVQGEGRGVFVLYDRGRLCRVFAHRRLREKPPSGGVSVLSESTAPDPELCRLATTILDRAGWHGVAMVEFKVARDGTPYLMEVNPRFWGSLQLAIDAGVDFPWLLLGLATGEPPVEASPYRIGVRTRWLLGDLDHLYLQLRGRNATVRSWSEKVRLVTAFCRFLERNTRYEVNRWEDLGPFLFELRTYLKALHA